MKIGIGVDGSVGLSWAEQRQFARDAVEMGYHSMWTPGFGGRDALQKCSQWNVATQDLVDGGIHVGTSVMSAPVWHPFPLAAIAAALSDASKGNFTLGIGASAVNSAAYRKRFGVADHPPIKLIREWVTAMRPLLAGESVTFEGDAIKLSEASLGFTPPPVPIHIGAMAEQMLRLAGEVADGATLNWCSAERHRWSREQVNEGARRAGRDPSSLILSSHIRVCVDDDVQVARRGLAVSVSHYALVEPGESTTTSYRGQFGRMGYDKILTELEARRDGGEPIDSVVDAIPDEILDVVGCYGTPEMVAEQFARLSENVDVPIVRIVNTQPGLEGARHVIRACRPEVISRIAV